MKNNKGFTLIEMIGIIILLTVIMIVVAPSMIGTLKNTNIKRFNAYKEKLKNATENYIVDNGLLNKTEVEVELKVLLENKYIDDIPSIPAEDPLAEDGDVSLENATVKAIKTSKGYSYQLCNSGCKDF